MKVCELPLNRHANCEVLLQMSTPLFPLPSSIPFPGEQLPLYVFEQRYCELLERVQETGEPFGMVRILQRSQDSRLPFHQRVSQVGTLAHLTKSERHEDGTQSIVVVGGDRFRIQEFDLSEAYLAAKIEPFVMSDAESRDPQLLERTAMLLAGLMRLHPDQSEWIQTHAPEDPLLLATFTINILDPADEFRDEVLVAETLKERLELLLGLLPPRSFN